MREFFKNYGSAIGPALAFLLGILAFYIHHTVNTNFERAQTLNKIEQLKQLINESPPPTKYHPRRSESGFMHADEARNLTNISRFYNRLLASKVLINNVEENIFNHGGIEEIRMFNNIKWWHDFLLRDVEKIRNSSEYDIDSYHGLVDVYKNMKEATENPDQMFNYIE